MTNRSEVDAMGYPASYEAIKERCEALTNEKRLALARALHPESAALVDAALMMFDLSQGPKRWVRLDAAIRAYQAATTPASDGDGL